MKSSQPLIVKVFEVSTCHITSDDDKRLHSEDLAYVVVYHYEFGSFVHIGDDDSFSELVARERFSGQFIQLYSIAKKNGCEFLQLDCDGQQYEDLIKFEW